MNFISLLPKTYHHATERWHNSESHPGVRFATRQVSLKARIDLTRTIRQLISQNEFLRAGDALEQTEASMADLLAKRAYLEWGIAHICGLKIDGKKANLALLLDEGPEPLCDEMVATIRAELELSEDERKNS